MHWLVLRLGLSLLCCLFWLLSKDCQAGIVKFRNLQGIVKFRNLRTGSRHHLGKGDKRSTNDSNKERRTAPCVCRPWGKEWNNCVECNDKSFLSVGSTFAFVQLFSQASLILRIALRGVSENSRYFSSVAFVASSENSGSPLSLLQTNTFVFSFPKKLPHCRDLHCLER